MATKCGWRDWERKIVLCEYWLITRIIRRISNIFNNLPNDLDIIRSSFFVTILMAIFCCNLPSLPKINKTQSLFDEMIITGNRELPKWATKFTTWHCLFFSSHNHHQHRRCSSFITVTLRRFNITGDPIERKRLISVGDSKGAINNKTTCGWADGMPRRPAGRRYSAVSAE